MISIRAAAINDVALRRATSGEPAEFEREPEPSPAEKKSA
jgi:hypothetical protein